MRNYFVVILIINLKIHYSDEASLNYSNAHYFEHLLQRRIRKVAQDCETPVIPNGSVNILSQKKRSLLISVECESNFVLQPEEENLFCINGNWNDEIPECKKCKKRTYTTVIDETMDSQLICPESLDDNIFMDCGQRKYETHQPFIVNGTKAKFAEFPWHVAIYRKDQNDSYPVYQCGGSIITEKSILTVAHCFADDYGNIVTSREYYVAAGKFHRNYNSDRESTQNRKVVRADLHPRYKGDLKSYEWDIAVVTLDRPFEISNIVLPVCVDWKNLYEDKHLSPDVYGEVAGWGKTEKNMNDAALELRVLKVPFIDTDTCNKHVPSTFLKYITHDKFCAGYMNGSSVCGGDSGGGLVFERQEMGETKYYIRGLVSLGIQKHGYCDSYKYSTYTKVSEYLSFIKESIQNRNDTTSESSDNSTTTDVSENTENSTEAFIHCKTPIEEDAKCISLYDCKIFVDALQKSPTPDVIKFINDSQCGTLEEKNVCCGSVFDYGKCIPPTIKNGRVHTIRQKNSPDSNLLIANIICDENYVLQPSGMYLFCLDGIWNLDEMPECKKCVRSDEFFDIDKNTDSLLLCPDSLNDSNCGQRNYANQQPVEDDGTLSKFAEFPWHVAIYKKDQNDLQPMYRCAGSIINEITILTVAHCFTDFFGKIKTSREYYVAAGKFHRNYNSDLETTQIRKVVKAHFHPRYKGGLMSFGWDIAVVILDRPFEISSIVHPVCIDWSSIFETSNVNGEVAGWGNLNTNAALQLHALKVPIIDTDKCHVAVPPQFLNYLPHDKLCTGTLNGSSVCGGDIGGGLVFKRQERGKAKYYIRGLLRAGLQRNENCNSYKYGIYIKVSEYISFIRDSIQDINSAITSSVSSTTTNLLLEGSENSTEPIVSCKTPNEDEAECISLYDCKIFVHALQKFPTPNVIRFIRDSRCDKLNERKVCCGSAFNSLSVIHSNPVTTKPFEHSNLHLLPKPGVCGRGTKVRENRMYGEINAEILDFPWMTLLINKERNTSSSECVGFLINERYVLTLASCMHNIGHVRLGDYDTSTEIDCVNLTRGTGLLPNGRNCTDSPLDIDIENVTIHSMFDIKKNLNNIALIRLAEDISFTDFIRPICLPLNGEMSLSGKQMTISKWDCETGGKRKYFISAISKEECVKSFESNRQQTKIFNSHVCAGYVEPKKVCRGVFGSPLMTTLSNSSDIYAEGIELPALGRCGDYPIVSTKLTSYMDWILDNLES